MSPKFRVYFSKTETWSEVVEAEDDDAVWDKADAACEPGAVVDEVEELED